MNCLLNKKENPFNYFVLLKLINLINFLKTFLPKIFLVFLLFYLSHYYALFFNYLLFLGSSKAVFIIFAILSFIGVLLSLIKDK
jgi:hypothetical protein